MFEGRQTDKRSKIGDKYSEFSSHLPNKGDVDSHAAMLACALIAQKDADIGAAPLRVLAFAVKANLERDKVSEERLTGTYLVLRVL